MNNTSAQISIIIPVKNEERRIEKCLKAISQIDFDQKMIEIIVVDNGSSDATLEIAKKYDCKIYVDPNKTVAGLRNLGALHARGEVFCFVDADILVGKDWLKTALKHFKNPDVACITGKINIPNNPSWVEKTWALNRKARKDVFSVKWASSMNMIILNTVFQKINGFSSELTTGEDVNLSYKLRLAGFKIMYDKKVSVTHTGEAKTINEFIKKERWRGYSDLDLLLVKDFKISNLRNATQPIFFIFAWLYLIISITFINNLNILFPFILVQLLPIIKTTIISLKQGTVKYVLKLIIIWNLYYFARSAAIFDNLFYKIGLKK